MTPDHQRERSQLRNALALHRGEASPSISFSFPLEVWLDDEQLQALTQQLGRHCSEWEWRRATPMLGAQLPKQHGVYMFVWASEFTVSSGSLSVAARWVLYVGKAIDTTLSSRYANEYRRYLDYDPEKLWDAPERTRAERLGKYFQLRPLEYWFATVEDRARISGMEGRLIRLFNPPLNVQGGARLRKGRTIPAF